MSKMLGFLLGRSPGGCANAAPNVANVPATKTSMDIRNLPSCIMACLFTADRSTGCHGLSPGGEPRSSPDQAMRAASAPKKVPHFGYGPRKLAVLDGDGPNAI